MNVFETKLAEEIKVLKAELSEANERIKKASEMLRLGKDELNPADMGDLLLCGVAQTVGALNAKYKNFRHCLRMQEQISELKNELSLYKEGLKEAIKRPLGVVPDCVSDNKLDYL
tara:strand:+ start:1144 stop:1488 length:345 start_codon:yes stop_codon:yes gene_type:complete